MIYLPGSHKGPGLINKINTDQIKAQSDLTLNKYSAASWFIPVS